MAEFTKLPEALEHATIGAADSPWFPAIGTVIRGTANGYPTSRALIPSCHLGIPF